MSLKPSPLFDAVVFDAYGTILDVYSVGQLAEELYPGHGAAIANGWRDKQIEYTRLITLSDPDPATGSRYYRPFWELTEMALRYTLERLGLPPLPGRTSALMGQYERLTPFPENMEVLQQLKAMGMTTAILSNANTDMLQAAVVHAGMADWLDHVISVDSLKLFKTSPHSYALVQQALNIETQRTLFVSSNAWDALGATWYGLRTLWVNRQGLPHETLGPRPTHTGTTLRDVLDVVSTR